MTSSWYGTHENRGNKRPEARKGAAFTNVAAYAALHYVACRDFANFSIVYFHSNLEPIYKSAADAMEAHPRAAELVEHINCAHGASQQRVTGHTTSGCTDS